LLSSWILAKLLGQNLDGDAAFQACIPSAVHLSHAASAKRRRDFIGAQLSAWSKGHRWRDYSPRKVICHASTGLVPSGKAVIGQVPFQLPRSPLVGSRASSLWAYNEPLGSYPAAPITCCFRWTCQCANSECLTKGFTPPVRGVNSCFETVF